MAMLRAAFFTSCAHHHPRDIVLLWWLILIVLDVHQWHTNNWLWHVGLQILLHPRCTAHAGAAVACRCQAASCHWRGASRRGVCVWHGSPAAHQVAIPADSTWFPRQAPAALRHEHCCAAAIMLCSMHNALRGTSTVKRTMVKAAITSTCATLLWCNALLAGCLQLARHLLNTCLKAQHLRCCCKPAARIASHCCMDAGSLFSSPRRIVH